MMWVGLFGLAFFFSLERQRWYFPSEFVRFSTSIFYLKLYSYT
jgi:hypothetical protein